MNTTNNIEDHDICIQKHHHQGSNTNCRPAHFQIHHQSKAEMRAPELTEITANR